MTNPCSSGSPAISRRARRQQQRHAPNAASTAAAAPRTPTVTLTAATPPSESFGGGDDGGDGGDGGGGGGGDGGDGGGCGGGLGHGWEPHVAKQLFRTTSEVSQNCTRAAHHLVPRWSTQAASRALNAAYSPLIDCAGVSTTPSGKSSALKTGPVVDASDASA